MIPGPVVQRVADDIWVVRDDLLDGGTKRCYADILIAGQREVVYATPAYGGAQIAIAHSARLNGARATLFVAKRKELHPRTVEARQAGATVVQVPHGYLNNVQSKARAYAEKVGALLLPFGLEVPVAFDNIAVRAQLAVAAAGVQFEEVWCVGGSGVLVRGLQRGIPGPRFNVVQVGRTLRPEDVGSARVWVSRLPFERDAKDVPPFPSCSNYDAKGWSFCRDSGRGRRLFWNVAR